MIAASRRAAQRTHPAESPLYDPGRLVQGVRTAGVRGIRRFAHIEEQGV